MLSAGLTLCSLIIVCITLVNAEQGLSETTERAILYIKENYYATSELHLNKDAHHCKPPTLTAVSLSCRQCNALLSDEESHACAFITDKHKNLVQ